MAASRKGKLWLSIAPLLITVVALLAAAAASMYLLSGVRAYVGGEGLWSKAQKDAIYYLVRYARLADEADYQRYQAAIAIPLGDRKARVALDRRDGDIDYEAARQGFLEGKNHPDDIDALSTIFVRLRTVSYIARAIDIWAEGDRLIARVVETAEQVRAEVRGSRNPQKIEALITQLQLLNDQLRPLEDAFSYTLGDASRWATALLISVFCILGTLLVATATLIYGREINQTSAAEAALRTADRRKDEFIAILAHELRNPLAPIRNAVEIMRLEGSLSAELGPALEIIDRQTSHLTRLVDDLLEVSRITQGKVQLRKERIDLAVPVKDAVETARPLMQAAGHTLSMNLPAAAIYVHGDATRITQITFNLLGNAVKFTPRRGHIWLNVEHAGSEAVIRVRDSGVGIPEQHLADIFEMFSQVTPALERTAGGLGIGLALVRGLVELHGGTVTAGSAGTGKGSEFVVRLPLASAGTASIAIAAATEHAAPAGARRRVLVVEDNPDTASSMSALLRLLGHEVREAHDGVEAIDAAEVFRPDLVLLDIGLPKLNGYDTAREMRRRMSGHALTIVAITGWGQEEDKRRSAEAGFDLHLTKPVDAARLQELLGDK